MAERDPNTEAREAFDAIILRSEEGDPQSDWLPTIARLAREGRAALEQAGRALEQKDEALKLAVRHIIAAGNYGAASEHEQDLVDFFVGHAARRLASSSAASPKEKTPDE